METLNPWRRLVTALVLADASVLAPIPRDRRPYVGSWSPRPSINAAGAVSRHAS